MVPVVTCAETRWPPSITLISSTSEYRDMFLSSPENKLLSQLSIRSNCYLGENRRDPSRFASPVKGVFSDLTPCRGILQPPFALEPKFFIHSVAGVHEPVMNEQP